MGNNSSPHATASAAHCTDCDAEKASDVKVADAGWWTSDLKEVCHQKERFAAMEAWLISLPNSITEDLDMVDCKEEDAIRCSTKKKAGTTGIPLQPGSAVDPRNKIQCPPLPLIMPRDVTGLPPLAMMPRLFSFLPLMAIMRWLLQ